MCRILFVLSLFVVCYCTDTDYDVCTSLCCISPVLAANVVKGCQVTIGTDSGTAAAIEQMGSKHVNKNVTVSFRYEVSLPSTVCAVVSYGC